MLKIIGGVTGTSNKTPVYRDFLAKVSQPGSDKSLFLECSRNTKVNFRVAPYTELDFESFNTYSKVLVLLNE